MVELSDQFGKPYFTKGGQGKFFQDPKPIAEHRYQRGYTPERMNEVADSAWSTLHGPGELQGHFKQVLARSTAPLDALHHSISSVRLSHGAEEGPLTGGITETTLGGIFGNGPSSVMRIFHGAHDPSFGGTKKARGASRLEKVGTTIIHELGHAHHAYKDASDFAQMHRPAASGSGYRESVADAFATKHYRPDPRDVRRGLEAPAEDFSYPALMLSTSKRGYKGWAKLAKEASARRQSEVELPPSFEHEGEQWSHSGQGKTWHVQGSLFNDRR